jgi:hypothetical protein
MLPDPNDDPSLPSQASIGVEVSVAVRLQFVSPPLRVVLRLGHVFGASVPEASIHEDGNSVATECDVDSPSCRLNGYMKSIPIAHFP